METEAKVESSRWLTIQEARERVGVSRRTIYNWLDKGKLDTKRTAGGKLRINPASLWQPSTS